MAILPFPLKSNNFIDESELFKLVIGTLKLPLDYMDKLTPLELGWLLENHNEKEQEKYELMAYAFQVGYIRASTGKKIEMFKKHEKPTIKRITKEQKEQEFAYLENIFKG